MKTTITKIGNSKGMIIPAPLLKQCGFEGEVSLRFEEGALIVTKAKIPRSGWQEAFAKADKDKARVDDFGNDFDNDEWTW